MLCKTVSASGYDGPVVGVGVGVSVGWGVLVVVGRGVLVVVGCAVPSAMSTGTRCTVIPLSGWSARGASIVTIRYDGCASAGRWALAFVNSPPMRATAATARMARDFMQRPFYGCARMGGE